jgi:hypothetical protein
MRLGGPQGRSGRVRKIVPTGTDWAIPAHIFYIVYNIYIWILFLYFILYILCNKCCFRLKIYIHFIHYWKHNGDVSTNQKTVVKHTSECRPTSLKLCFDPHFASFTQLHAVNEQLACVHSGVRIFRVRSVSARVRLAAPVNCQCLSRNAINTVSHAYGGQLLVTVFETKFPSASQYPACKYMYHPSFLLS